MQTKWVVEIFFLEFLNLSMSEEDSHLKSLYFMKYVYESFLYKQTQHEAWSYQKFWATTNSIQGDIICIQN